MFCSYQEWDRVHEEFEKSWAEGTFLGWPVSTLTACTFIVIYIILMMEKGGSFVLIFVVAIFIIFFSLNHLFQMSFKMCNCENVFCRKKLQEL